MLVHLTMSGISNGCLYAVVAMGLVVVFKATNVINFAHGESFMLGGFLGYTCHVMLGMHYFLSIVLAVVVCF